jgi:hypothetical protein
VIPKPHLFFFSLGFAWAYALEALAGSPIRIGSVAAIFIVWAVLSIIEKWRR